MFSNNLRQFFGDRILIEIHGRMVEEYRDYRRRQPSQRNPKITVKGATVNREIEWLQCVFQFAVTRKYIAESNAAGVRHFDERRERPAKRMLTVEEEQRIFETAPPYLRVAIVLLVQTGGRTYSEGLSLRWDQVDLENQVIHLAGELKTSESAQPLPLTRQVCEILHEWKNEQRQRSPFLFPSPRDSSKPIGNVRKAWRSTLKKAGVSYFQIYNLRHVFCTRLGLLPMQLCNAPCATVARRRNASINWGWFSRCASTWSEPTTRPTKAAKRYICVTAPLRKSARRKWRLVSK